MSLIRRPRAARRFLLALPLTLAVSGLLVSGAPVALAGELGCSITNVTHPMGTIGGLDGAVEFATAGDTLNVRGTCHGTASIGKNITIVGKPSDTLGPPILDGNSAGRVVSIDGATTVKIRDLTIQFGLAPGSDGERAGGNIFNGGTLTLTRVHVENGNADDGGGIYNLGTLTVVDSVFYGNEADRGGAIFALGPVTLKGTTDIGTNFAANGGGIFAVANLTITGSTSIHHNEATVDGGGIAFVLGADPKSALTMAGNAVVHSNQALEGGGVSLQGGVITLDDKATVRGNEADNGGGVLIRYGSLTLNDSASVRGNHASTGAGIDTLAVNGTVRITMTGRSSVKANVSTAYASAILLTGSLTMKGKAVVRDNVDQGGVAAIATVARPDRPVTFTMRDDSRVTSHELPAGGSAVAKQVDCGTTTFIGTKTRVVGNTPKNIKSYSFPC